MCSSECNICFMRKCLVAKTQFYSLWQRLNTFFLTFVVVGFLSLCVSLQLKEKKNSSKVLSNKGHVKEI